VAEVLLDIADVHLGRDDHAAAARALGEALDVLRRPRAGKAGPPNAIDPDTLALLPLTGRVLARLGRAKQRALGDRPTAEALRDCAASHEATLEVLDRLRARQSPTR
jgi:hypothetical protein